MVLKKSFLFILLLFFTFFFFFFNLSVSSHFNFMFLDLFFSSFCSPFWGFSLSFESLSFFIMVCLVTSMVVLFGQMYMEHYNNKKFFFLTMTFLSFMILLGLSSSSLCLMIGWDGLGVSSLLLIMFYPGKIPLFNSYLTFFYNRLGDSILMIILVKSFSNPSSSIFFFPFSCSSSNFWFLLLICSLTKSAQFPLSSWLPAAMSAPTPISAMVHSSTLVTAGLFIFYNIMNNLQIGGYIIFLAFVSGLTFLVGGLLSMLEKDFKKIVAFSTMSQISMIIFFLVLGFLSLSISHMIFHSLFKTLLFCACGIVFIHTFSDQNSIGVSWPILFSSSLPAFIFSLFSMTGLPFSVSFFSKDVVLELLFSVGNFWGTFLLVLGSLATLLYSSKIVSCLLFFNVGEAKSLKNSSFAFFWVFCFFTLVYMIFVQSLIFSPFFPCLLSQDFKIILFTFFSFLSSKLLLSNFTFTILSSEIFFSKNFGGILGALSVSKSSFFFSDQIFFKPSSLPVDSGTFGAFWKFNSIALLLLAYLNFF